jgi:Zn-dependent metalloprotease/PKD repeat protein
MKRILLGSILTLMSVSIICQENGFKSKIKDPAAHPPRSFKFTTVRGNSNQGKGKGKVYNIPNGMRQPLIRDKQNEIRKIIKRNGSPIYIEKPASLSKSSLNLSDENMFNSFVESVSPVIRTGDPRPSFKITGTKTDELGIKHISACQVYKGVKIYGSESALHLSQRNEVFTGRLNHVTGEINTLPEVDVNTILSVIINDLKKTTVYKELTFNQKELLDYSGPQHSLVLFKNGQNDLTLTYEVEIRPNFIETWKYFADACTGEIISRYNITRSDGPYKATATDLNGIERTIDTYLEGSVYSMTNASEAMYDPLREEGIIITLDANNTSTSDLDYMMITSSNNTWNNPAAVSAHYNATTAYEQFLAKFGRNSINGNGGNIISLINVAEDDGSSMENAFWNGKAVFYGNGGSSFKPLSGALDVTAHELGHGIVSSTANLEYIGQSGAMNETYADIFGTMVDSEDWLLGEDIVKPEAFPSGALRNMADPHNTGSSINDHYWQPKHVSEMYLGSEDNGGVHINSGIGNYAYYLFAMDMTREKAEQVFYRALVYYLKKTSRFIDFRIAVIQAATDLYGSSSPEALKAAEVFDKVGIYEDDQVNYAQDYPVNPGQDYLLSYDTNESDPATLYRSSTSGTGFVALTNTEMKGKVSVADDGSFAAFVRADSKIGALSLDPGNPAEITISDEAFWDNVAVSKDGNRLAAISNQIDTAIYVYDFVSESWVMFMLYNPTTSHNNTDAGGVLFADAIEFDITGEYLIYDAINVLSSTFAEDIYYWDIGFINVWDNQLNTFGDGNISKLYESLPEHVSLGNPVFSKNSPYIIAFDYFDNFNDDYAVLGANLLSGDVNTIVTNTVLGYPSYSKYDNTLAYSALTTTEAEIVATIALNPDKISGAGSPSALVNNAKWPVYYATGIRPLGIGPVSNFTADFRSGPAPLNVQYLDISINDPVSWTWSFPGGTPSTSNEKNPLVIYNTPGTYSVTLTTSNSFGSNIKTKTDFITVSLPTGNNEPKKIRAGFYPNPVSDILNIVCESPFTVSIYNMQGNLILKSENTNIIDLQSFPTGIYIIKINSGSDILVKKLIKK